MAGDDAPRAADGPGVDGPPFEGPMHFGSGFCALDAHIILIHRGEVLRMPLATAIAMRDALTRAIDIPVRAAELAAFDRDSG